MKRWMSLFTSALFLLAGVGSLGILILPARAGMFPTGRSASFMPALRAALPGSEMPGPAGQEPYPKMMRIVGSDAHFKFLHREHAKTKVRTMECKDCHTMDADGVIEIIPQHPQCVECHLQRSDVKPPMLQCAGCHVGYEFDDSRRTVSYAFTHRSHLINKKTRQVIPCEECHQQVQSPIERFDMTIPAVHECMQCHNGRESFIVYDCARCHNPITAPDSHRLETMDLSGSEPLGREGR